MSDVVRGFDVPVGPFSGVVLIQVTPFLGHFLFVQQTRNSAVLPRPIIIFPDLSQGSCGVSNLLLSCKSRKVLRGTITVSTIVLYTYCLLHLPKISESMSPCCRKKWFCPRLALVIASGAVSYDDLMRN